MYITINNKYTLRPIRVRAILDNYSVMDVTYKRSENVLVIDTIY